MARTMKLKKMTANFSANCGEAKDAHLGSLQHVAPGLG
jgi:hypothetical protein